jgi:hypothetical protein
MVAGNSGPTPGSGAAVGVDVRLMLPQAPKKTVSAEAIPRLAIARAQLELFMAFPET